MSGGRKVRSTRFATIPDDVRAFPTDPPGTGYRVEAAYRIERDGTPIGTVIAKRVETYRKHGRIRYPTGTRRVWTVDGGPPRDNHDTMADAVAALLTHHDHQGNT